MTITHQVENALLSLDWNGVEEREELEERRAKLTAQLDEAVALKVACSLRPGHPHPYHPTIKASLSPIHQSPGHMSTIMEISHKIQNYTWQAAIDRRSATVADYVESYLGSEERERFLEVVATKVRLMVEIREIQEKVGILCLYQHSYSSSTDNHY